MWIFLCVPTFLNNWHSFEKNWKWTGRRDNNRPIVYNTTLFYKAFENISKCPFTLPTSKKALYFPYRRKTKPEMPDIKLLACHVSGSHSKIKAYQTILQRYASSRGEMAPDRAMTAKSLYGQHFVMNGKSIICSRLWLRSWNSLKSKGFSYNIINSARSTLSAFITQEGLEAAKHPLICRYKKGLYNINPCLPKYSFTWDIGIVVKHLSGILNNLKQGLSGKLASLLAILCCQRAREILAVMDLRNICFEKDVVIICIGDLLNLYSEISSWWN